MNMDSVKELELYINVLDKKIKEKKKILDKYLKEIAILECSIDTMLTDDLSEENKDKLLPRKISVLTRKRDELNTLYNKENMLYNGLMKKYELTLEKLKLLNEELTISVKK